MNVHEQKPMNVHERSAVHQSVRELFMNVSEQKVHLFCSRTVSLFMNLGWS